MKEVVLDTETTGLEVKDGHRIVEIGCIELENQFPTSKKFHYYLNPERKVSEKALEVHGYTDEFLASQKKFSEVCDEFLNFIENKKLIIHNAGFDLSHLNNELSLVGKKKIEKKNIIDTLELARDKFPGSPANLDALCKRFRVDNSRRTKHTALMDCELLSKIYINLIDQKEPTLDFKLREKEKIDIGLDNFSYCKKIIYPTKEETINHKQYLKSFFKNFFLIKS
jgi:DNA polymerase-3 subunit epsilon